MAPAASLSWFEYETGQSWCESANKYQTIAFVAEFANTISNLPIIVLPLLNVVLLRRYVSTVNWEVAIPHLLLTFNGFASAYYHATVTLFGQLVDELSLLWLIESCLVVYLPIMRSFPDSRKDPRLRLSLLFVATAVSGLCFIRPDLNALALMAFSVPGFALLYQEGVKSGIEHVRRFSWQVMALWIMASSCWIADRLLCPVWLRLGFPYLHAAFHILSSLAAYILFVLLSLLDMERRSNEHQFKGEVHWFPGRGWPSLPYLSLIDREEQKLR